MTEASNPKSLFTPAHFHTPPGPPVALGAALAIWLFAQGALVYTLMALLVAALVGIGYVRARREAIEATAKVAEQAARIADLESALALASGVPAESDNAVHEMLRNAQRRMVPPRAARSGF
jgi:hypothetical protein